MLHHFVFNFSIENILSQLIKICLCEDGLSKALINKNISKQKIFVDFFKLRDNVVNTQILQFNLNFFPVISKFRLLKLKVYNFFLT